MSVVCWCALLMLNASIPGEKYKDDWVALGYSNCNFTKTGFQQGSTHQIKLTSHPAPPKCPRTAGQYDTHMVSQSMHMLHPSLSQHWYCSYLSMLAAENTTQIVEKCFCKDPVGPMSRNQELRHDRISSTCRKSCCGEICCCIGLCHPLRRICGLLIDHQTSGYNCFFPIRIFLEKYINRLINVLGKVNDKHGISWFTHSFTSSRIRWRQRFRGRGKSDKINR